MALTLSTLRTINDAIASRRQGYGHSLSIPHRCFCCGKKQAYWVSPDCVYICEVCGDK